MVQNIWTIDYGPWTMPLNLFSACDKTVIRQFREYLANQDKFDFCSELDLSQSDDEVNL